MRSELRDFLSVARDLQPRAVIEIGTARGGTLFMLARASAPDVLVGDSHAVETRAKVERTLRGRRADILFIDGDHTFEGVSRGFELYCDLLRPGGLIAFHDIVDGKAENVGAVPDFWRSVRTSSARDLIADPNQGGFGIGLLSPE